ncbi:MAG: T9SS type B sorting domain-containing protein [Bacteroidetes bacterium]|nr:MAG: T9SS type B sorting domain-containing protein [Bacteroidota bacterium]
MARKIRKGYLFHTTFLFACCLLPIAYCFSQAVPTPDVKCVAVFPNGDVTITWVTPPPGAFVSYHIDTSSFAAGPFTTYTTVPTYSATSCTHVGAGANTKRMYYQVLTESSISPILSNPKDVFSTIFLTVTNPGNGTAVLAWNKISTLPIPTSSGWYKVYREYPSGVWTLRDSTQTLAYTDVIDICGFVLNYRIEIADNTGCTSVSNIAGGGVFSDITPPALSPIDTVSVDAATSQATISWIPSPSLDVDSVVIYQFFSPIWNEIATVPVPTTFYQNPASNAANVSEYYRIAVLDSCGNISPIGIEHKTIYLSVSFNICAATADLIWNKYVNWTPAASQYEIWKSVNAGPFSLIGTNISSDTSYLDTGLVLGTPYCYFIRATNGTKTSSSNRVCFSPNVTQPPAYTYNRFATVTGDKSILLKAHVDFSSSVKYYRIHRATGSGSFSIIIPATLPTAGTITYTDNDVNTSTNVYHYKIDAMDSCGHVIETSSLDTTILLSARIAPNLDINLSWNDYGSWLGSVDHYTVYRSVDGVWDPAPAGTVSFTGNGGSFTDDIAPYLTSKGNFAYYVVAVEGSGNIFGFTDTSASNVAKVDHYPKIYVPNAFTPNDDGLNDVFIPVIGFIEAADYSLMIFDRTGTPVFESINPAEGWDGKKKGHRCQAGVYMYLVKCKASNGDDSKISGTVSLFR